MSDPIQTYGMDKIDDLVVSGVTDERIDIPEEIQTQMADEIEPEPDIERDLDVLQRLDPNFINDPVRLYLREIAETPLLTHAQEIDLAKRVENADQEAVQQFVRANLRQRVLVAVAEPEAQLKHQLLARGQRVERGVDVALEHRLGRRFVRCLRDVIGDQITETGFVFGANWRLE